MATPPPDQKPVEPKPVDQVEAMRAVMRTSMNVMPLGGMALAAIEAADDEIDAARKK
jgi:hypothetical protein